VGKSRHKRDEAARSGAQEKWCAGAEFGQQHLFPAIENGKFEIESFMR